MLERPCNEPACTGNLTFRNAEAGQSVAEAMETLFGHPVGDAHPHNDKHCPNVCGTAGQRIGDKAFDELPALPAAPALYCVFDGIRLRPCTPSRCGK